MTKPTARPFWQAASPSPRATWVLPVPLGPSAITFSRRATYSPRASSSTSILFSDGIAAKSKLSRLFTAGKRAWRMRRSTSPPLALQQLELGQPQQVGGVVHALRRALPGELVVLAQEGRQLQRLEVVRQQDLRGVAHAAPPSSVM